MTDFPNLIDAKLELTSGVAQLVFQRDDVRNALTGTHLIDDIVNCIEWANHCPDVSVLVMTGDGKAFSAGGNIKQMHDREGIFSGSAEQIQENYRHGIQRIPLAMHHAEIPLIAAINGPAIGAGMDLACMCDLRIASSRARLGETFINLGIIPGDGGAWFLQRLIGYQRAAELTLTGRIIDANEALELGLVLAVVEPEELLPQALELATQIAAKPAGAVRFTKRLLKQAQRQELADFLDLCACFQGMCHHTDEHREAVAALLQKQEKKNPTDRQP